MDLILIFHSLVTIALVTAFFVVLFHQKKMIERLTDQLLAKSLPEFVQSQINLEPKKSAAKDEKVLRPMDSVLGGIR